LNRLENATTKKELFQILKKHNIKNPELNHDSDPYYDLLSQYFLIVTKKDRIRIQLPGCKLSKRDYGKIGSVEAYNRREESLIKKYDKWIKEYKLNT
jgi:hypothetical protein